MRLSEAHYLTQKSIIWEINKIHLVETKHPKERSVPIVPIVREFLERRKKLKSPSSERLTDHYIVIRRACGIHDTKLHNTCKRFTTDFMRLGIPLSTINEWVGYESFEETMNDYIGLDQDSAEKLLPIRHYTTTVTATPESKFAAQNDTDVDKHGLKPAATPAEPSEKKVITKGNLRRFRTDNPRVKDTRKNHAKKETDDAENHSTNSAQTLPKSTSPMHKVRQSEKKHFGNSANSQSAQCHTSLRSWRREA